MFKLQSVGVLYNKPNRIEDVALCMTTTQLFERLRQKLLERNQSLVSLSETTTVPDIIIRGAKKNIHKNPYLQFELRKCNDEDVVFIDGQCPEMDYYRVIEFGVKQ